MSRSPRARTEDDAPPTDWLGELPQELHLRILEGVDDFSDCAAFSLASPRLGLLALRSGLARFKDPLFAVAMRLLLIERFAASLGSSIMDTLSEATLRKYAADRRAKRGLAQRARARCGRADVHVLRARAARGLVRGRVVDAGVEPGEVRRECAEEAQRQHGPN